MTGISQCDRCNRSFPAAPTGTIHKCQCTGGMCSPIPTWEPEDIFTITGRGTLLTGAYPLDTPEPRGRLVAVGRVIYEVIGYERMSNWGPLRKGSPCGLLVKLHQITENPVTPPDIPLREHYHTELIKRYITRAIVQVSKGLGMAQASRLSADDIITLFDPTHKRMEPFCNCPTGIHDDAFDPGGPMSGMPRPYCPVHNTDSRIA